jgi:hypothetical protein
VATIAELVDIEIPKRRRGRSVTKPKPPQRGWRYISAGDLRSCDVIRIPGVSGPSAFRTVVGVVDLPDGYLWISLTSRDGTEAHPGHRIETQHPRPPKNSTRSKGPRR